MLSQMIPIAVTPFRQDGALDLDSIALLCQFYHHERAQALIVLGIMGEAHALSDREREDVIAAAVASARIPVIATVSAPATEVAAERARRARCLGAHYVMVAAPPGISDPDLLYQHFSAVAAAGDLPWVLQDEPVTTGVRISSDTMVQLATISGLAGIKVEDVPTPSKIAALHARLAHVPLFGGLGGLYLFEELRHGSAGSMTGFSYPGLLSDIIAAFKRDDADQARHLFYQYLPLIRYEAQLGVKGIAIRKALLAQRGLIASPAVRAPQAPADAVVSEDLLDLVQALGLALAPQEGSV
jgi:4-hydroxy-tetrahydrodipicolinate synthase